MANRHGYIIEPSYKDICKVSNETSPVAFNIGGTFALGCMCVAKLKYNLNLM